MKTKCGLAGCLEPVKFLAVFMDKKTFKIDTDLYCEFDYPEAWDLESLKERVTVFRIADGRIMKKRGRIYSEEHRYKK